MKSITLWTCPKCKRQFLRQNQSHSCKIFPLVKHFEGKEGGKLLFEKLKQKLEKKLGSFKIQSLECCIHFNNTSTFAAVKILRNKIQVEFSLPQQIANKRIVKTVQLSASKLLHFVNISNLDEIDTELINWIHEAFKNKGPGFLL